MDMDHVIFLFSSGDEGYPKKFSVQKTKTPKAPGSAEPLAIGVFATSTILGEKPYRFE
jgi:hypothetical protein